VLGDRKLCEEELEGIDIKKIFLKDFKNIKKIIWKNLGLIKVFTKARGKGIGGAMALKKGAKIRDAGNKIHKDFIKDFKFARLWRDGSIPGKIIGLNYKLKEKDIIEFRTD